MENDTFSGKVTEDPENDVNVPFGYEEVEVDIDNKGIVFLWWENRMQAGEIQQENVQLLPFEKIQAIIEEQITMQDAAREIDWKIEDNVTSVELGTLCILTPNEKDVYTMVPGLGGLTEQSRMEIRWALKLSLPSTRSTEVLSLPKESILIESISTGRRYRNNQYR